MENLLTSYVKIFPSNKNYIYNYIYVYTAQNVKLTSTDNINEKTDNETQEEKY